MVNNSKTNLNQHSISVLAYPNFKQKKIKEKIKTSNSTFTTIDGKCESFKDDKIKENSRTVKGIIDEDIEDCVNEEENNDDEDEDDDDDEINLKVTVPGTNIVLENDEDIQKWIEERKKNWPTNKRVKEKVEEREKAQKILKNLTKENTNESSAPLVKVCNFWMKTKRCKNGKNCRFSHDPIMIEKYKASTQMNNKNRNDFRQSLPNHKTKLIEGIPIQIPQRFTPLNNKGKSLHSLIVEGERFKEENLELINLFEKLVKFKILDKDWDNLKKKINLDDDSLSMY